MKVLCYLNEIWKDIPDFEGKYQASNFGRIKSLYYGKEKILKPSKNKCGYLIVFLYKNGIKKTCKVHRLVWMAFNGEIPEGYEINHINEDKTDNRLENLSLMSHKDNINWGTRTERMAKSKSKSVFQYDLNGNLIKEFPSTIEVERQLGFSQGNISLCCTGKYKTCGGFIWKFK